MRGKRLSQENNKSHICRTERRPIAKSYTDTISRFVKVWQDTLMIIRDIFAKLTQGCYE